MDTLEETIRRRTQVLVEKLQKMNYPLLGIEDDVWIMELLFKPGIHRYHLLEWILSKLSFNVTKIPGTQNSEERIKNIERIISDLGLCQKLDVVKGTAALKKQLLFWYNLVELIWLKYEITPNVSLTETDEGIEPEKSERSVGQEFEDAYSCMNEVYKTVNIKNLFNHDIQLLPPNVQSKVQNMPVTNSETSKIPSLQEFQSRSKGKAVLEKTVLDVQGFTKLLPSSATIEINRDDEISDFELNQCEEELCKTTAQLQISACKNFQDAYENLKPLILNVKPEEFTDVGPSFAEVEPLMENMLQLKKSVGKMVSSNSKLLTLNSELEELRNCLTVDNENYSVFKLLKIEK